MFDKILIFQKMLTDLATGGALDDDEYLKIRNELLTSSQYKELVPDYIKKNRTTHGLWTYFKSLSPHWEPRRVFIESSFQQMLDIAEGASQVPFQSQISDALSKFGTEGIEQAWGKALERKDIDPDGAVTASKTMIETVCKQILDKNGIHYSEKDDMQKLYYQTALVLNLAPSQHTEELFKSILGNCQSVVNSISTIRNKIGDAHGQGIRRVKPNARHAGLVVNLAGSMSIFLVETYLSKANKN